jgi:hemerythrin-like domain-containing protein
MIIDLLHREHRNIEKLLTVLEHELDVFDRADRPDYEVIRAVIAYFEVYPGSFHHPQEDKVFQKLRERDPGAAREVGDLAGEHGRLADDLRRVAQVVEYVLAGREVLRTTVDRVVREFIDHERSHIQMEERNFFPAAIAVLKPEDWTEIGSTLTNRKDPLFSDTVEQVFENLREHILRLEREAEADR